jgi:transcriptional regulator with XRE-family HTH domain
MTPAQCRAARALAGMTQSELAAQAGLGLSTVVDFEKQRRTVSVDAAGAMRRALERIGVVFNPNGAGVTLELPLTAGLAEPPSPFSTHMDPSPGKPRTLSSAQIRAARALVRWSAQDLARASALGVNTIRRAELAKERVSLTRANELAIRRALEGAGVLFIDGNGGGPGVRLRER